MGVKAVIFDLDGTITRFNLDYKRVRAEVRRFLAERGLPHSAFSLNESVFDMLRKAEIYMRNSGRSEEEIRRLRGEVFTLVDQYELDAARQTSLLPGARSALKAIRDMGLKMAILTVSGEKPTNHILESLRIRNFFDVVVTRESTPAVKPNPIHLKTALKLLEVKPSEAVMVGDSERDMKCAREVGVRAIGVLTGISNSEELMRAGADCLATSFTDLVLIIERLSREG